MANTSTDALRAFFVRASRELSLGSPLSVVGGGGGAVRGVVRELTARRRSRGGDRELLDERVSRTLDVVGATPLCTSSILIAPASVNNFDWVLQCRAVLSGNCVSLLSLAMLVLFTGTRGRWCCCGDGLAGISGLPIACL